MKQASSFILLVLMLASCVKEIPVDLTGYDEKKLVAEGKITNQHVIQEFKITWTSDLGALPETANDVVLSVTTPSGPVNFTSVGKGLYQSDVAFAGITGEDYTISFMRENTTHSVTTTMPGHIAIDSFRMVTNSVIPFDVSPGAYLTLNADQDQYFRYDLFRLQKDSLPDSVWTNVEIPVYEAFPVAAGQQQVSLKQLYTNLYVFGSTDVVKIYVYSLSKDVYVYLDKLRTFMTAEPKGGKYENPPYYYTNEAYGLGYGTSVDSAWYVLP